MSGSRLLFLLRRRVSDRIDLGQRLIHQAPLIGTRARLLAKFDESRDRFPGGGPNLAGGFNREAARPAVFLVNSASTSGTNGAALGPR